MSNIKINKEDIINFSIELFVLILAWASYYPLRTTNYISEIVWGLLIVANLLLLPGILLFDFKKLPKPYVPWRSGLAVIFLGAYVDIILTLIIGVFLFLTWLRHILHNTLTQIEERNKVLTELQREMDLLATKKILDSLGINEDDLRENCINPKTLNSVNKKIEL